MERRAFLVGAAAVVGLGCTRSPQAALAAEIKDSNMTISKNASRPSQSAPAEHFTGTVRLDPLFQASAPARVGGAYVTFEPCARSDWHTHPLGQTLIVTFGCGLHQRWGGPVEEIRPGDVVTVGPNEQHYIGTAA